jgi:hypothetical protein
MGSSIPPSFKPTLELPGVESSVQAVRQAANSLHEFLDGKTGDSKPRIDPYKKP